MDPDRSGFRWIRFTPSLDPAKLLSICGRSRNKMALRFAYGPFLATVDASAAGTHVSMLLSQFLISSFFFLDFLLLPFCI